MTLRFADPNAKSTPLYVIEAGALESWLSDQDKSVQNFLNALGFKASIGQAHIIPDVTGVPLMAVAGFGTAKARGRGRFALAAAAATLPDGDYHLANDLPTDDLEMQALGWLLSGYSFDKYKASSAKRTRLKAPSGVDAAYLEAWAAAEVLVRDLVNTPTSDLSPADLETTCRDISAQFGATIAVTTGDDLIAQNYPMIHTVGRASATAPRLIDMRWGKSGPKLTLVGKGVCFDTGGLDIKPASSMGLMKKDMGGAANVLGLASMIMARDWPVQLRVLIPAVENSISANAFRPGDILKSRKGLTVEINNTDAEGRLVLADALALADEDNPDLILSMATLTGAARVAVGPDIAPFFATDDALAAQIAEAAPKMADPVWRMPFWDPYETLIEPSIADLDNAPGGGMAGSITAALFLRRFVETCPKYAHFDIYSYIQSNAPARSKGGISQGIRALYDALPRALGL